MLTIVEEIENSDEFQEALSIIGNCIGELNEDMNVVDIEEINTSLLENNIPLFIESDDDGYETPIDNMYYFYASIYYHYKGFILKNTFYTVGYTSYEFTKLMYESSEEIEITQSKVTL